MPILLISLLIQVSVVLVFMLIRVKLVKDIRLEAIERASIVSVINIDNGVKDWAWAWTKYKSYPSYNEMLLNHLTKWTFDGLFPDFDTPLNKES
jgi:hypothetical protein